MGIEIAVETGAKRCFAFALDWPGWCRGAKTADAAIEALDDVRDRYRAVAEVAGHPLPRRDGLLTVVERLPGGATTDFGAPEAVAAAHRSPCTPREATRLADLLGAAWSALDTSAAASGAELRRGPRGGGRDRDAIVGHVDEAEVSYARALGVAPRGARPIADARDRAARRDALLRAVRDRVDDQRWPLRYAVHRIAWHALDHAWEIDDKQLES